MRFVTKTAKPSARESAGGFAFVPATCRIGDIVGLSKNGVPPLRLFYGGKMQNCRRRVADWFRSSFRNLLASDVGVTSLYFGIGRLWRGAVLFASKSDALFASTLRASGVDTPRVNPSSGELGKNAL